MYMSVIFKWQLHYLWCLIHQEKKVHCVFETKGPISIINSEKHYLFKNYSSSFERLSIPVKYCHVILQVVKVFALPCAKTFWDIARLWVGDPIHHWACKFRYLTNHAISMLHVLQQHVKCTLGIKRNHLFTVTLTKIHHIKINHKLIVLLIKLIW